MEDAQDAGGAHEPEQRRGQGDDLADDLPGVEQAAIIGPVGLVVPVRVVDDLQAHMGGQGEELALQRGADLRGDLGLRNGDAGLQQSPGGQEAHHDQELGNGRTHPIRGRPLGEQLPQHCHRGHQPERRHRGRRQLQDHDRDGRGPVRTPGQVADPAHDPRQPREYLPHRGLGRGAVVHRPVRLLQSVGDVTVVRPAGHGGGRQRKFRTAWAGHRTRADGVCVPTGAHAPHLESGRAEMRAQVSGCCWPHVGEASWDRRRCSNRGR